MTKVEMYAEIMKIEGLTDEMKAFLQKESDLVEKRNANRSSKPTKTQKENVDIKLWILAELAEEKKTVGAIAKKLKFSNQKINSLMTQLINEGKVERVPEKRVAYFQLVNKHDATTEEAEATE